MHLIPFAFFPGRKPSDCKEKDRTLENYLIAYNMALGKRSRIVFNEKIDNYSISKFSIASNDLSCQQKAHRNPHSYYYNIKWVILSTL